MCQNCNSTTWEPPKEPAQWSDLSGKNRCSWAFGGNSYDKTEPAQECNHSFIKSWDDNDETVTCSKCAKCFLLEDLTKKPKCGGCNSNPCHCEPAQEKPEQQGGGSGRVEKFIIPNNLTVSGGNGKPEQPEWETKWEQIHDLLLDLGAGDKEIEEMSGLIGWLLREKNAEVGEAEKRGHNRALEICSRVHLWKFDVLEELLDIANTADPEFKHKKLCKLIEKYKSL